MMQVSRRQKAIGSSRDESKNTIHLDGQTTLSTQEVPQTLYMAMGLQFSRVIIIVIERGR